jgi:hypothetical protein
MVKEKFLNVNYIFLQLIGTNIKTFNQLLEETNDTITDQKIYRIAIYLGVSIEHLFKIENNKATVISRDLLKNHTLQMNYSFKKYLKSVVISFLTGLAYFNFSFDKMFTSFIKKPYAVEYLPVSGGGNEPINTEEINEEKTKCKNKFKIDKLNTEQYVITQTNPDMSDRDIDENVICKYKGEEYTHWSHTVFYISLFLAAAIVLRFANNFYINHKISNIFHEKEDPIDEVVKLCSKKSLKNLKSHDKKLYNIVSSCNGNSKEELEKLRYKLIDYHLKLSLADKFTKNSIKPLYLFREDGHLRTSVEEIAEAILYYRFDIFRYGRPVITYFKNRWTNKKVRSSSGKKTSSKKKS